MGILENINQLKKEGISEREIITKLQNEGNSPKEIMDALSQAQIKSAVSTEEIEPGTDPNMTPSMMAKEPTEEAPTPLQEQSPPAEEQELYSPQKGENSQQPIQNYYTPQQREEEYYSYEDAPEGVEEEYYEAETTDYSPNTTIEIAEQVFAEKTKKMQKQLRDLTETKTILETKVEDLSERLKRMEKVFDKMQLTIIDKVSHYGENLNVMKKEMHMIEDSFTKLVNPLVDKYSQHKTSHKK
ncbi:hypothetical protein HOD29_01725 [archaeon]|jgi:hypothetical protein|nr:hypothetical protein [archaeon]